MHLRLTTRVALLTTAFVMLAEVLIFVPSVTRYRESWLDDLLADAHLMALAIQSAGDDPMISAHMGQELLETVGVDMIDVRHADMDAYRVELSTMPPDPSRSIIRTRQSFLDSMMEAMSALVRQHGEGVQLFGPSPVNPRIQIELIFNDQALIDDIQAFGVRILVLSLLISAIVAAMLLIALHIVVVRPVRRLIDAMITFADNPEDGARLIRPSGRSDELGQAENALATMEHSLRSLLVHRTRLASLGTAVVKINHDLRNMLTSASLMSERLEHSDDPTVRKLAPRLVDAIDRAVRLCGETLTYTREGVVRIDRAPVRLRELAGDLREDLSADIDDAWQLDTDLPDDDRILGDREQLRQALSNIGRNALEAGARQLTVSCLREQDCMVVHVTDDGPGLPPKARANLFQPFSGSARAGGTGLGLAIAHEILRAHGGDLWLARSDKSGTHFCLRLPAAKLQTAPARATAGSDAPSGDDTPPKRPDYLRAVGDS